jgi:excinuclease UvrABC nuclease subunit
MIGLAKRQEDIVVHKTLSVAGLDAGILSKKAAALNAYITESGDFMTINLAATSAVTKLLQRIRDESHRFAVSYHTVLRRNRQTKSLLDEIPGVGPETRKKLIRRFGSMRAILNAQPAELQSVLGVQKGLQLARYLAAINADSTARKNN